MSIRPAASYIFLLLTLVSAPVSAQTVVPTNGAPYVLWDGSLTGFRLSAPNTQLNGEVLQGPAHTFVAGTRGELHEVISTTSQSNHSFPELIHGVSYNVWVKAQFTFTTQPMAIPSAADGTRATFSTPFTATGTFAGYSDQALTNQVFSVSVQGSGVAVAQAMRYDASSRTWSFVGSGAELFQFTGPLPSPWSAADIGAVGVTGISSWNNNVYYVAGAGGDIWGTADAFQFVSQPLAGDGSIVVHVNTQQSTSTYAKAGIMIRQSASPSAPHVILDARPGGLIEFMTRGSAGGGTTYIAGSLLSQPWLKLSRAGGTVTAAVSADGTSWTTLGTAPLSGAALIGLAVTSHDTSVLNQSGFDNVVVAVASSGAGGSLPIGWSHADVGAVGVAGDAGYAGGTFSVSGAGGDIWGTADAFHFAYTQMNSAGSIEARIVSESTTHAFAKAGLMFRESLNPSSNHVILDVKPDGFVEFMSRETNTASTTYIAGIQTSFPASLKLQRILGTASSIFIAYVLDGSNAWRQLGWVQIPMGPDASAGVAVTSHTTSLLNDATFDTVHVVKNLLVEGGFEDDTPPALAPPGWVSDQPLRAVAAVTDIHPHDGDQNGACIQTTYQDCGLYQEVVAPDSGAYTLTFFATSDRGGSLAGVNVDGQTQTRTDVPVRGQGNYGSAPLTLHFSAAAGATIRVWLYSPASPGFAAIDDVSLTQDF